MANETFNNISKIEEALGKYNLDIDDAQVKDAVKRIIAEKVPENDTMEVKKFLFGSIELTTLKTTDSEESVLAFTERVNDFDARYPGKSCKHFYCADVRRCGRRTSQNERI